jgi:hypothetical protein
MKQRFPLLQWLSVYSKAVPALAVLAAVTLFAPSAFAQCVTADNVNLTGTERLHYNRACPTCAEDPNLGFDDQANFNVLGLLFRAGQQGKSNGCVATAAANLKSFLIDVRQERGSTWWQQFLSGAYVTYVMAAGMEISGRGYMDKELDLLVRDVGEDYTFTKFAGDPCGLYADDPSAPMAGLKMSRRANSCMDDYAIAASGFAWKAAYWRASGRYYQSPRNSAISYMRNSLLDSESICVHSPLTYWIDTNMGTMFEAPACNKTASDLDGSGDAVVISLNHGNQTPAYGFGLLTSVAAGAVALEVANNPISTGDFSPNELKALKHLWKEAVDKTNSSSGAFRSMRTGDANCYNMAGLSSGSRTLQENWGCEDQQFGWGDTTEQTLNARLPNFGEGNLAYDARWYPMATFYDRYSFTKGSGGGYAFSTFSDPDNRFSNNTVDAGFYGPGRYETYNTLSSVWFNSRPPLTARSEFRLSLATYNTYGGRYFYATNGGGSSVVASAASPGVTNTNFEIVDLDGALLDVNSLVAIRVTNIYGQQYYLTAPSGGGTVSATATGVGTNEQFRIEKVSGSPGTMLSHLDYFALKAVSNNRYMEAVSGGGGNIITGSTTYSNYARFRFNKTELPRNVY